VPLRLLARTTGKVEMPSIEIEQVAAREDLGVK
jgi:hypothetical protein